MKHNLLALVLLVLLPSCGLFDTSYTELAKLPRNDVAGIAAATAAAVATPDLDLDGNVNGLIEWEAFIRAWVQAYQAAKKQ